MKFIKVTDEMKIEMDKIIKCSTYCPTGRGNKVDKDHPEAHLEGKKIIHTYDIIATNPYIDATDNGFDIEIAETVVVQTNNGCYETRCISKRYQVKDDGYCMVNYKFRNVKKDGSLGKKYYSANTAYNFWTLDSLFGDERNYKDAKYNGTAIPPAKK